METNQEKNSCGLLLVGHGTRNVAGLAEFAELADLVRRLRPNWNVQTGFLELASPDIASGIEQLVDLGFHQIIVVPVLLFAAGHAKRDIPEVIETASVRFPHVRFLYSQPLECDGKLLEQSEQRFREAVELACIDARDVSLLLVGRGSHDEAATRAMHQYGDLLADRLAIREHRVAFLAMAQPSLEIVLTEMTLKGSGAIVVQPHLLFQGDLLHELYRQVSEVAQRPGSPQFFVAGHLGATLCLAEALAEIVERASR